MSDTVSNIVTNVLLAAIVGWLVHFQFYGIAAFAAMQMILNGLWRKP